MNVEDFDPNVPQRNNEWATFDGARRVRFKSHSSRATALNSLGLSNCALYRYDFQAGRWELIVQRPTKVPMVCERCGGPSHNSTGSTGYRYLVCKWVWERSTRTKIKDPLTQHFYCAGCRVVTGSH